MKITSDIKRKWPLKTKISHTGTHVTVVGYDDDVTLKVAWFENKKIITGKLHIKGIEDQYEI